MISESFNNAGLIDEDKYLIPAIHSLPLLHNVNPKHPR